MSLGQKTLLFLGLLGLLSPVSMAGPSSPPAGNYLLNVSTISTKPAFNTSSGTVRDQLKILYITPGSILGVNNTGVVEASTSAAGSVYIRSGYSNRFTEAVNVVTAAEGLDQIFDFGYIGPGVSLSASPVASVKELGTTLSTVTLSAFTVKTSSPITIVQWKRNGTVIKSSSTPVSTGGTEVYADTGPVTATAVYTATAGDGTSTTTSNSITFTFVYPFYYGVGAQALSGAAVQALTKLVQVPANTATVTSPSTQVYYFAYPQTAGALTSILDTNGFETISGYTQRSESLTMLDATSQPYYIYEFNTPTTQTSFTNTYKF